MHNKVMDDHFSELIKMSSLLKTLVDSYRLLIAGAVDVNILPVRRTKDVERALDRADEVGKLIDRIVDVMDEYEYSYIKFSKIKNEVVSLNYEKKKVKNELNDVIQTEINNELNFFNSHHTDREENKDNEE
ncbi:MAG: hypothetical protein ACRCVJ_00460 [Clostridium sp.]|uniref:hypothetical protein n=1 Tax=Clostridium sp. TaxID=1506 RepID=UPI003F36D0E0